MAARVVGGWAVSLALVVGCNFQSATPDAAAPARVAASAVEEQPTAPETHVAEPPAKPKLYDVDADGLAQIAVALETAASQDKRVLLQFGAEWCGWCHKLHHLFAEDEAIADALAKNYVVVLIDVDGDHNAAVNEKYGDPMQHGLPVIVVLDADGAQLTTKDTAELEEGDHHDPALVLEFLREWAPDGPESGNGITATQTDAPPLNVSQN